VSRDPAKVDMPNNNELVASGRKIALTGTSWTLQIDAVDAVASPDEGDDATLADVRCSVGSVATTGKLTRAGHLVVDVSASVRGASEALDLAGAGELGPEFTALKAQCADLLTRALSSCEVAVRPGTGDLAYVRVGVKTGEPALSWRILGEHALTLGDVTLAVFEPHDEWLRRFEATLSARVAVGGHEFTFALTNARTAANPRGVWRLAQTAPTSFRSIVALVGAARLAEDLPEWARGALDNTAVTGLALALDLPACSVYSLSGGLEFHKIPILGLTDEQGRIDRIGLDLAVDDPFSAARRRLHFWFNGEATILGHKFTLAGGKSGRSWTIAAGYVGRLSLTDALGRLLGDVPALFDDFDLSLIDPTVAIDDDGFSFACGVAIARDQPVSVGIGALVFSGGRIEFGRRSGATVLRLRASLGLVVADGPKLDRLALSFDHEGDKATRATLDAALELPVAGQKPVVVTLTGDYTAGKHGGFELVGTCKDLSLRTIADALGAGPLPDEFPELTITGARVEVDSRKQLFRVKGRVAAGTFTLADRQIEGSSLEVGFATSKTEDRRTTEFSVEGKTRIGDTTCKFKLKAEPRGTTASVTAEGKISIADLLRTCGVNVDSDAGDEQIEGAGFDYESVTGDKKGDDKQPDDKQPDVPRRRFELHARGSGDKWRIALVLARFEKDPYEKLLLVRFADVSRLKGAELRWSTRARTLTLHDKTTERFPGGPAGRVTLALAGTRVAALLKQDELPLEFDARGLRRSDTDPPGALPVGHSDARTPAKSDTVEPADGDAGVSLGGVVTLRNMRLGAHATPRPALTFAADIGLQIGPWVSIAVQQARVTITPTSLSLVGLAASGVDFDLDGAAVVVKLPPWLRAGAAIVKQGDAAADILRVSGLGDLDLLGKLKIRVFVDLGFGRDAQRRRVLTDAFAFVCASGFALGTPAITVTGLAGGLGYNRVLTLPARPQEVPGHPAIALLRGVPGDGDPALEFHEGQLRVRRAGDVIVWSTGTRCTDGLARAGDGHLVVFDRASDDPAPKWSSRRRGSSGGQPSAWLRLSPALDLEVCAVGGAVLWSSRHFRGEVLAPNSTLAPGDYLEDPSRTCMLIFGTNGVLDLRIHGSSMWTAKASGAATACKLEHDGDLVLGEWRASGHGAGTLGRLHADHCGGLRVVADGWEVLSADARSPLRWYGVSLAGKREHNTVVGPARKRVRLYNSGTGGFLFAADSQFLNTRRLVLVAISDEPHKYNDSVWEVIDIEADVRAFYNTQHQEYLCASGYLDDDRWRQIVVTDKFSVGGEVECALFRYTPGTTTTTLTDTGRRCVLYTAPDSFVRDNWRRVFANKTDNSRGDRELWTLKEVTE